MGDDQGRQPAMDADASHPLTQGYELLAERLHGDATFQEWLATRDGKPR